jgi:hypothetical protein
MLLACLLSTTLDAHHSFSAQYDASRPVEMKGIVTKVEWTNPHVRLYLDVPDEKGQPANWNVEMASPNVLVRNGWKQGTVKPGDQIVISGYLARKGDRMAIAGSVADASGRPLFASTPADLGR